MKKNNLLKAIAIAFVVYVLLTWFIPTGYFNSGSYVKDIVNPLGILDLIRYPIITMTSSVFVLSALVILLIGGFYGVLNKTGAYQNLIEKKVKKYTGRENKFLIFTTVFFVTLSSLTALNYPLFILVPMFATILLSLGYNKIAAMLSTVGSILVGNMVSTYGFNISGYISYFSNDINNSIIYKIILFVLILVTFLFTVIRLGSNKEVNKEIMLYEKTKEKKSSVKLVFILIIMLLLIFIGMINWSELFKITIFNDLYDKMIELTISGYPVFKNIFGSIYSFGSWTNYELALIIFLSTVIIAKVYNLSFKDFSESFKKGIKEMLPVAIYMLIANIIFLAINTTSNNYTIFPTIANYLFELVKGFNVLTFGIVTFIGSIIYNDFPYLLGVIYDPITTNYTSNISIIGILLQSIYGLVQLFAPTSILLVIGLKYFNIDYKEWLKNVFKFILLSLLIIIIVVAIMIII